MRQFSITPCVLAALICTACVGGREVTRTVVLDGKTVIETRPWRDPKLPFEYETKVTSIKASLNAPTFTGGLDVGRHQTAVRAVEARVQTLSVLYSQLANDWNAFCISQHDYGVRSRRIEEAFLRIEELAAAGPGKIADIEKTVAEPLAPKEFRESYRPLRIRVWILAQRLRAGGVETFAVSDSATLASGEKFRVGVHPNKECYAYLVIYDSQGRAEVYFPSKDIPQPNRLSADREALIPSETLWFELDDKVGSETIYVFASEKPDLDIEAMAKDIQARNAPALEKRLAGTRGVKIVSEPDPLKPRPEGAADMEGTPGSVCHVVRINHVARQ